MDGKDLTEVTTITDNLRLVVTLEVTYSLGDCKTFPEARRRVVEAIEERAPEESKFYRSSGSEPNRPIGLAIPGQPPLTFTRKVEYYAPR